MVSIQFLRDNRSDALNRLKKRGKDYTDLVDEALTLDGKRRGLKKDSDEVLSLLNSASKEIGALFKAGNKSEAEDRREEVAELKVKSGTLTETLKQVEQELINVMVQIPNVPHETVPAGNDEAANEVVKSSTVKEIEEGLPHWDLAKKHNLIDFELGNKITGSGFPVFLGKGAQMQRALVRFFLDQANAAGYMEVIPPLLVNESTAFGTGQLPDKEGQMYFTNEDGFYLIPTAEVPVTNIHRGDILDEKDLPKKYTSYTPCFRREAGSYGKDVRGLNRVHQFDKVEIVQLVKPTESYGVLEQMVAYVEKLVNALELPYRILKLCGGDLGFAAATTYDFEVYASAQKRWLEVSSVSNFETYQSNRMSIRYRDSDNNKKLVHTLNGSALALPRILAALLENNQVEDGIKFPSVLVPYLGFDMIN